MSQEISLVVSDFAEVFGQYGVRVDAVLGQAKKYGHIPIIQGERMHGFGVMEQAAMNSALRDMEIPLRTATAAEMFSYARKLPQSITYIAGIMVSGEEARQFGVDEGYATVLSRLYANVIGGLDMREGTDVLSFRKPEETMLRADPDSQSLDEMLSGNGNGHFLLFFPSKDGQYTIVSKNGDWNFAQKGRYLSEISLEAALILSPFNEQSSDAPAEGYYLIMSQGQRELARPLTWNEAVAEAKEQATKAALLWARGNRIKTAEFLGINRTTLFNHMRKYGLLGEEWKPKAFQYGGYAPPVSKSPSSQQNRKPYAHEILNSKSDEEILEVMDASDGNISEAARRLGVSYGRLYSLLRKRELRKIKAD